MEKEENEIKSKFLGVFKVEESSELLNEYKDLVNMLSNKLKKSPNNKYKSQLNNEEIKKIFDIKDENIINFCNLTDEFSFFSIILEYKSKENMERTMIINFKKTAYKFIYEETQYYCFDMEYMKNYLEDLQKKHDYYIEFSLPNSPNKKKVKDITRFLILKCSDFKILISYQFKDIDYKKLADNPIYIDSNDITGKQLNLKLGHYVSLLEKDYNEYRYYHTKERDNFFRNIDFILSISNIIGFCGPYGTGKTITLLKMIMSDKTRKSFYINLITVKNLYIDELRKLLRYEAIKLFGKKVLFSDELYEKNIEKIAYDNVINLINNFDGKNIFSLLMQIIPIIKPLSYSSICFIIDQYNSKNNNDKEDLKAFIGLKNKGMNIIICSSMDNDSIKTDLCKNFEEKAIFPLYKNPFIFYLYVGSLVRLNKLSNYNGIIDNESEEFINYLNYFGNIPLYYYSLKRYEREGRELKAFLREEKESITNEIKLFYENKDMTENDKDLKLIMDLLYLMKFINEKSIFFFDELNDSILKLPLKFLEIKKEKLKINDLKLYGLASHNQKIIDFIIHLEEKDLSQEIINKEYILNNYTKFFNEEKYCINYISKLSNKEKKMLNFTNTNYNLEITIFYLDYLFPLIEEIFSGLIYKILSKSSKLLYSKLFDQSKEDFLEYIIRENVKNKKLFLSYTISNFEVVQNSVPNEFFIQNYSSRKNDTIKTFIENNDFKIIKKKLLPKKNIFFYQIQFTDKYYDCAILIPNEDNDEFILLLLQISQKIISTQRFYREEHIIIINRVKSKLEKEYDIKINEAHFSYIFTYEKQDLSTIKFCENNNLNYFLFSIDELDFKNIDLNDLILNEKTLITKTFPFHSTFSILPREKFEIKNDQLINYKYIQNIQNQLIYENISNDLKILLEENYAPLYKKEGNEFFIFGHFDDIFDVNDYFCIWFNNNDMLFYYKGEDKYVKSKLKFNNKLSNKNYSLICSKYKLFDFDE